MGWTGFVTNKPFEQILFEEFSSHHKVLKFYEHEEEPDNDELECSTFYAAVKHYNKNLIFGLVVLFKRVNNEVLFKEMDETMNPFYYDCPNYILDILSPLSEFEHVGYAKDWRNKCRQNNKT